MTTVNLVQLAKHLNLSKSTVSKALKDSHEISAETKRKVLEKAKDLNYQPNPYASSLRKHKSKTIAVIITEVENNFFSYVIKGIEMIAQGRDYHVLIYLTYDNPEKEVSIFNHLKNRVDGIIMSGCSQPDNMEHIKEMMDTGVLIVFIDRVYNQFKTAKVTTDDFYSSFKATEHLIEKGCKRIACLAVLQAFSIGNKRLEGYLQALQQHGIAIDESLILKGTQDYENNHQLIKTLMLQPNKPDGIFALVEKMATTFYYVSQELGIRIPQDVKVIGFANLATASLLSPALSTITQPAFDMGEKAATVLLNALERKRFELNDEDIVLPSVLIERMSTNAS